MTVIYIISGLIGICGIVFLFYNVFTIFSWIFADKIEATIIDTENDLDDRVKFCYEYQLSGKTLTISGPWRETFNPLLIFFPKYKIGQKEIIHINTKKNKIIQSPLMSLFYIVVSALIIACSSLVFVLF